MAEHGFSVRSVGRVDSSPVRREDAPRQGPEGAPEAWIVFEEDVRDAMRDLRPGDEAIVLTLTGVFGARSSDRPNPIGLHPVEAIDGTPVVDVKPVLRPGGA